VDPEPGLIDTAPMASTPPGEPPSSTVRPAASSEQARGSGGPRLRGRRGSEGPATVAVLEAIAEEPRYTNAATSGSAAVAAQPARRLEDFVTDTELIDDLSRRVDRAIKQRLGPDFGVGGVELTAGSLEVMAAVMAVSGAIQKYPSVREGLDHLVADLRRIVKHVLARRGFRDIEVPAATWTPGHVILEQESRAQPAGPLTAAPRDPFLIYLVLVHSLLLVLLIGVVAVLLAASID
jgi:hypothetical protein